MNENVRATRRQRVYDFLYDPVHTVSCEVDHVRSRASIHTLRRVPKFGSMFSSLPHHPGYTLQLNPTDPIPPSVDQSWRGHGEQHAGIIPRRQDGPVGADRWKFFQRPLIPSTQQLLPDAIYASPQENFVTPGGRDAEQQPTHVTVGVQTDYRESEAQTDPYSPEYVIRPGTTPTELLLLAPLTWGKGLPAGLAEAEMIERARAKRVWEASLPPLDDLSQLDKRRQEMEEMEAREWALREEEIQKLQESRLAVLTDLLMQRDEALEDVTNQRLNHIFSKLQEDRQSKLLKTQNDYSRSLRKLEVKGRNLKEQLQRLGSQFVPRTRRGTFTSAHNNVSQNHHVDSYEVLVELEAELSPSFSKSRVKRSNVIQPSLNKTFEMMKTYKALREEQKEQKEQKTLKPLRFLVKKEKPVPRPVTPRVEESPEGEEETELAVIHLQKLLRGRSVQYEMFQGKENHTDLIQDLRLGLALQREEQELQEAERQRITALKEQRDKQRHENSQREASQDRVIGETLENVLDTLSNELIRLQEERRIHAFTLLAERERRVREAEESGRRQQEEQRRREGDEIFRQVVQVQQETVDLYLEDIILGAVDKTADDQAREEIRRRAREINDIAHTAEDRDRLQSEEIVSELVYSFLIPEVEKINMRKKVHMQQQMHLQVARSLINEAVENSGMPHASVQLPPETASAVEKSSGEQDQQQEAEQLLNHTE